MRRGAGLFWLLAAAIGLVLSPALWGEARLTGVVRNDTYQVVHENKEPQFLNILENRVLLNHRGDYWRFHGDARVYLTWADAATHHQLSDARFAPLLSLVPASPLLGPVQAPALPSPLTEFALNRSFIRYYSEYGDFTVGKNYVNIGNFGLFNPFEPDKTLDFGDINYDKEGQAVMDYRLPLGQLSTLHAFGAYSGNDLNYQSGLEVLTNIKKFDIGAVYVRKGRDRRRPSPLISQTAYTREDRNEAGLYLKGDLEVGVQADWNYHFNDEDRFSEARGGLDYSFFDGKLILTGLFYFNESGATQTSDYQIRPDAWFQARYYAFLSVAYAIDEFISFGLAGFTNAVDGSTIFLPGMDYVLDNGLSLRLQLGVLTGDGQSEFSRDTSGLGNILIRLEGKF